MPDLTYEFLLELYRGRAGVVEQLGEGERQALTVRTPLFAFVEEAARTGTPRHIILTGNAGDGKTFAAMTVEASGFNVIRDASASALGVTSPIEDLALRLHQSLDKGERLLVAINRGQLERLEAYLEQRQGDLKVLVSEARRQVRLQAKWPQDKEGHAALVAVIDLGLMDTLSPSVLKPMLERVRSVSSAGLSAETAIAFKAAVAALADSGVLDWVERALQEARARGHHATLRQIWSFFSFLVTGARPAASQAPLSLSDTLGARMFAESAEGPLFELARELLDPVTRPDPETARTVLLGLTRPQLARAPGQQALVESIPQEALDPGRSILRAVAVHQNRPGEAFVDPFGKLLDHLRGAPEGWHTESNITGKLLTGMYRLLRLPASGPSFPAWETLCYDSSRITFASSVSSEEINHGKLRIALPRPHQHTAKALHGAWRAPYVWIAPTSNGDPRPSSVLRVTPQLFWKLYGTSSVSLTEAEELTVRRWLGQRSSALVPSMALMVGASGEQTCIRITHDTLDDRTSIS